MIKNTPAREAFLRRLNTYGITREEFGRALKKVEEKI